MQPVDINRNSILRHYVLELANEYGVSMRFLAEEIGIDYNMFVVWKNGRKNYMDVNLDRIERIVFGKYGGLFHRVEKIS